MRTLLMVRGLGLGMLALAFLMPGHYLPWPSFQNQWVAAFGTAVLALAAAGWAWQAPGRLPVPPLALAALLCALLPWLQWSVGQLAFMSDAILVSSYFLAFALALLAGGLWSQAGRQRSLDALFFCLAAAASLSVFVAMRQWLLFDSSQLWVAPVPPGGRPFANLGQPNHLALLLILGVVATLRAHLLRQLHGGTTALILVWLGLGLVMTQSRTGWLMVLLLTLWGLAARHRLPTLQALSPGRLLLGAGLFFAAVLCWDILNDAMLLKQINGLGERLQSGPRGLIWQAMLGGVALAPWLGYGFNQAVQGQQAAALSHPPVQRMLDSAHNIVIDAALWAGVPFAVFMVLVFLVWLARRVRACRDADDWAVLAAVALILTHALLEYPLDYAYFLLPLGLLMGSFPLASRWTLQPRVLAGGLSAVLAGMLALLVVIGDEYLRLEQANRQVRLALFGVGQLNQFGAEVPALRVLDGPREYLRLMVTPARAGMSEAELDWMRVVTRRYAFPPAMMRYAVAAGLNNRLPEAQLTLLRLCAMHPADRCQESVQAWQAAQEIWPQLISGRPKPSGSGH